MDIDAELALRERIMVELAGHLAGTAGPTITRADLERFPMDDGTHRRLVDRSRGIWNPGSSGRPSR